jgi:hypothetical protein
MATVAPSNRTRIPVRTGLDSSREAALLTIELEQIARLCHRQAREVVWSVGVEPV